jgi:hypothetical protein
MNSTQQSKRVEPRRNSFGHTAAAMALALTVFALGQQPAHAGPREQAKRMYDRLTGTPPSPALLTQLESEVGGGTQPELVNAALFIMDDNATHSSDFYRVTLKNFATPWTNRDQTVFASLNDYSATVIGFVRDDRDFRQILSDDVLYVGSGTSPAYSATSNAHYEALESGNADLRVALQLQTQSSLTGIPAAATAGIITSRAASEAFFIDGTNRAMFRFTMLNHLCRDLEQLHDTRLPPDQVRQDVTRSPGGDSRAFQNNCVGCHNGMDPLARAFAYYDFDETQGRLVYTEGQVQSKYFFNADNFRPGFVTPDDAWENRYRLPGPNRLLGWASNLPGAGRGAKSMGQELASSEAFAQCQVEKVFKAMCFRAPSDASDLSLVQQSTAGFRGTGNLKRVFAETAAHCAGT